MESIKLNKLAENALKIREMNALTGGAVYCGCGCHGPSGIQANGNANRDIGREVGRYISSPEGNVIIWIEDDGVGFWSK